LKRKHAKRQQKPLCLQLVHFESPFTGIVWAPTDINEKRALRELLAFPQTDTTEMNSRHIQSSVLVPLLQKIGSLNMSNRLFLQSACSLICCFACLDIARGTDLPPFPDSTPYTNEQNEWLTERATLRETVLALSKTDLQQATTATAKMLTTDRQLFGNVHKEVASTLSFIEVLYYRQRDWFSASKAREEIMQITSKLLGEKSWRVREQQFERDLYVPISKFSDEQRQEFYDASAAYINARSLLNQGKPQEAISATARSPALLERLLGKDNPRHAYALYLHGDCLSALGRNAEAEAALTAAARIQMAFFSTDSLDYANTQASLGRLYVRLNSLEQAERALRAAIKVYEQEQILPFVGSTYVSLSHVYIAKNEHARALESLKRAIEIIEKSQGKESRNYVLVRAQLCTQLINTGDIDSAENVAREVLAEFGRHKEWGTTEVIYCHLPERTLINISLKKSNTAAEAMRMIRELKGFPVFKGRNATATSVEVIAVVDLVNLEAAAHIKMQDYEAADPVARELLTLAVRHKGSVPNSVQSAVALLDTISMARARVRYDAGKVGDGHRIISNLEDLYRTHCGTESRSTIELQLRAASLRRYASFTAEQRKRVGEAETAFERANTHYAANASPDLTLIDYERAVEIREALYPPTDIELIKCQLPLARARYTADRPDLAEPLLKKIARSLQEMLTPRQMSPLLIDVLYLQILIYQDQGAFEEAVETALKARQYLKDDMRALRPRSYGDVSLRLARCYAALGDMQPAESLLLELRSTQERSFGQGSIEVAEVLGELFYLYSKTLDVENGTKCITEADAIHLSRPGAWARLGNYLDGGTLNAEYGDVKLAIATLEWAQQQLRIFNGPMKPLWQAACQRALAIAYFRNGETAKAEAVTLANVERQRKKFPESLAACEQDVSLFAKIVEKKFRDALSKIDFAGCQETLSKSAVTWRNLFGAENWRVLDCDSRLKVLAKASKLDKSQRDRFARLHADANEFEDRFSMRMTAEAAAAVIGIMSELKELVGTEYPLYERLRGDLVTIFARIGDLPNAEKHSSELVQAAEKLQGRASELVGQAHLSLVDLDEAQRMNSSFRLLTAHFAFRQSSSSNSLFCGMTFNRLGRFYLSNGQCPFAERNLRNSLKILSRFQTVYPDYYEICLAEHGTACSRMGDIDRAEAQNGT
jgi:tetratricopeptide (TPR) repeat protein